MRSTERSEPPTTEQSLDASAELDRMPAQAFVELMCREDQRATAAVAAIAPQIAAAIERIAVVLQRGGRLLYAGAGTSGRLGMLDAVECPPTFSTPPAMVVALLAGGSQAMLQAVEGAEDDAAAGRADIAAHAVGPHDVVVGISASGSTPYVLGALGEARARGAACIGITCNDPAELAPLVDLFLPLLVGPEVLAGSTRLKAGTATKLVLNMLSTGAMIRLGKSYGNLMVDVAATNQKLRRRALGIVARVTGLDAAAAAAALAESGGEVKTCIVAQRLRIPPAQARARLAACGGHVRAALAATP